MKVDGYSKHTHSLTYTDTRLHIHPPTHPRTHARTHAHTHTHPPPPQKKKKKMGEKEGEKGGFDRHTFYKTRDYNINRKWKDGGGKSKEEKKLLSLYMLLTSEFTDNKFQKVC